MEYLEDGKVRLQFNPIPDVWDDFLSYRCPLVFDYCSLICAECLSQYIWGLIKSKLPAVMEAEGIAEVGRLLVDKGQQETLIL